ncbi:MAG: SDR family oxidoreductase [Lachnospiraceae bacterium]|nr:SDR family oxidoreductase [Lachnospiraceae bacterium]
MISLDMKDRVVLITGASGQLGRVMTRKFADCHADVIIHYNSNAEKAQSLAKEVRDMGRKAYVVRADVTDRESVFHMRDEIRENFVLPDIIVDNAVIQYDWKSLLEQDPADYYSQFESCVMQTVYMAKAFAPQMQEKHWGRIICTNTECAAMAEENCSAYTSAKRGLDGIVRVLAKELGSDGITVNQVAPGWTISEKDRTDHSEVNESYDKTVPLRRRGTDDEIANMVVFLASDLASFTTGAYIPVSGGRVMPAI